jgi:signal peptidase I
MSEEIKSFLKEVISIVVIAFVLAMILRTFVVEGRIIPTGSMLPTIQLQDRVMVNKFIYYFKEPERGDIVVFDPPDVLNSKEDYIKRVVGLPGDTIQVKQAQLYVNGQAVSEPYLFEPMAYDYGPVTVPEDALFVMGDNRNASFDSHRWNAWLTRDHLKGKAFLIYWPVNHITLLERGFAYE